MLFYSLTIEPAKTIALPRASTHYRDTCAPNINAPAGATSPPLLQQSLETANDRWKNSPAGNRGRDTGDSGSDGNEALDHSMEVSRSYKHINKKYAVLPAKYFNAPETFLRNHTKLVELIDHSVVPRQ